MKYIEVQNSDGKILVNRQEQPHIPDLSGIGRTAVQITDDKIIINEGDNYNLETNEITQYVRPLPELKQEKVAEIKNIYETKKYAPILHNGSTFDFPDGITNQADLSSMCIGATQIGWYDDNNVLAITNITQLKSLQKALNNRGNTLFATKRLKKQEVENATTASQVSAITWE